MRPSGTPAIGALTTSRPLVRGGELRVGIVLSPLVGGGVERVLLGLANALVERGHEVDLLLLRPIGRRRAGMPPRARLFYPKGRGPDGKFLRACRQSNVQVAALDVAGPLAMLRAYNALARRYPGVRIRAGNVFNALVVARYIREARPQLLLAAEHRENVAAAYGAGLALPSVPAILGLHCSVPHAYPEDWLAKARKVYPTASAVVAVSAGIRTEAEQLLGLDSRRVHCIRSGRPSAKIWRWSSADVPHPWFRDADVPVVLTVGKAAEQKDHATLVEAFAMARRRCRARLVIMGDSSKRYRARLLSLARLGGVAGDVAFLDYDDNPYRYMRRARLFVLSSRFEGYGLVLVEALVCGTRAVSTDAPHGPAEVLDGGKRGVLVPVGSPAELAAAIVQELAAPALSAAARERYAKEFDENRSVDAYEALFRQVVQQHGSTTRT